MIKKLLTLAILILFIGTSVDSLTNNIKSYHIRYSNLDSVYYSEEILSRSNIAYGYIAYSGSSGHPEGPCYFSLNDPSSITSLKPTGSAYFLTGGTWVGDDRWFGVEYNTGALWEIDPGTGDMYQIGGGGVSPALSYNPIDERLYAVCSPYLYAYNITRGERELVCSFDGDPSYFIDIAFDLDGVLYGWDYENLWIIDIETCECTFVGPFGINPSYGAYGHFDFYNDILFISTYSGGSGQLYECNEDTGECNMVGNFEGGAEITCLAIPNTFNPPPTTNIYFDPPEPDGENGWYVSDVTVTLEAIDADVNATYYRINEEVWRMYESPFVLLEDGEDILIEYYSDDIDGNIEDVKSATIDIDQTVPIIELTYEVIGGNPWKGWDFLFMATAIDATSGMDRVEFFLNEVLQETVTGSGPYYEWNWHYDGSLHNQLRVLGLIFNPKITDEYVKLFALMVIVLATGGFDIELCAYAYDSAGNWDYDCIAEPCIKETITPGIYLLKSLTLPNNYIGRIGLFFINAIFNIFSVEDASVSVEGTSDQIKVVLRSGGDNYGDGYVIADDVAIWVNGIKVSSYTTEIWVIGGEILIGLNGTYWEEGYMCAEGDYEVTVSIKNTVVFDGTVTVG